MQQQSEKPDPELCKLDQLQCRCSVGSQTQIILIILILIILILPLFFFSVSRETQQSPKMLSFPQRASLGSACHKLQHELILYYLFIGTVTKADATAGRHAGLREVNRPVSRGQEANRRLAGVCTRQPELTEQRTMCVYL